MGLQRAYKLVQSTPKYSISLSRRVIEDSRGKVEKSRGKGQKVGKSREKSEEGGEIKNGYCSYTDCSMSSTMRSLILGESERIELSRAVAYQKVNNTSFLAPFLERRELSGLII
jgi:hypothetical protein